jgi:chromosome segregation ATPase
MGMNNGEYRQVNEELKALRAIVERQTAEIEKLRTSARRANAMVDAVRDTTYALITEITDAQQKVNSLAYANPRIAEDICRLEEILGPADQPTPGAPPLA